MIEKHLSLLGHKAEDKITGFSGVIDCVSFDLYGCIQATLRPSVNDKMETPDARWFDVSRLSIKSIRPVMTVPDFDAGPVAEGKKGPADKPSGRNSRAV